MSRAPPHMWATFYRWTGPGWRQWLEGRVHARTATLARKKARARVPEGYALWKVARVSP